MFASEKRLANKKSVSKRTVEKIAAPSSFTDFTHSLRANSKIPLSILQDAVSLHRLGLVHLQKGHYESAAKLIHQCLRIYEFWLAFNDRRLTYVLDQLADCYFALESFTNAAALYAQAMSTDEVYLGLDDVSLIERATKLATAYRHLGQTEQAERLVDRIAHLEAVDAAETQKITYGHGLPQVFHRISAGPLVTLATDHFQGMSTLAPAESRSTSVRRNKARSLKKVRECALPVVVGA